MMEKAKPLVSVVIPTRNRAALVKEAIESVLAQDGAGDQFAMEVIVVDDASSDNTAEIVSKYPDVRYIRLAAQHGEGGARNAGIKAARGKYVAFLDDDDLMLPHRLRLQVPAMEAHPEVGVVYSQNIIRGAELRKWWSDAVPAPSGNAFDKTWPDAKKAPSGDVFAIFLKEEFLSMDTLLVRRGAFDKAGYFEDYPTEAHYDMFLRLAFYVPFLFVEGNVAINRVNMAGVFHVRLAGKEGCAWMLPRVVDRALRMLPDSVYSRALTREVHAALVPRIFCMLERIPNIEGLRSYVKIAFEASPWLFCEPSARNALVTNAGLFVRGPGSPDAATRIVCEEIRAAAVRDGFKEWLQLRSLLADIWMSVALSLAFAPESHRRDAAYAAGCALYYNPLTLGGHFLKLGLRIIFGPRLYSRLRWFKRRPAQANLVRA
jgi:glycosyltransferase involved in cell wall biosynthesis